MVYTAQMLSQASRAKLTITISQNLAKAFLATLAPAGMTRSTLKRTVLERGLQKDQES